MAPGNLTDVIAMRAHSNHIHLLFGNDCSQVMQEQFSLQPFQQIMANRERALQCRTVFVQLRMDADHFCIALFPQSAFLMVGHTLLH